MSDDKARRPRPLTTESGAPVADNQHSQTAGAKNFEPNRARLIASIAGNLGQVKARSRT